MKILMLTDFYPPAIGGVERHVAALSKYLVERGHEVAVCTVRQKGTKPSEIQDGVRVHRLEALFQKIPFISSNPLKQFHPPFRDHKLAREIERVIEVFKPDLIHSHGWITFSCLPLKLKFNIPVVVTLHHYGFICPRQDFFFKSKKVCNQPFTSACYSCCAQQYGLAKSFIASEAVKKNRKKLSTIDKFLAVSRFIRDVYLEHLNLSDRKIAVVPNFSNVMDIEEENCKDNLPAEFILYVGALSPHKGVNLLLEAYTLSNVVMPLVLIGAKHHVYSYRKYHDGKKIFIVEDAPRDLVVKAYKKCKFVVIPSVWPEPCPTTILEAMSFSKPVIASYSGGIPELVKHGETGYLVNPRSIQKFSEYIRLLVLEPCLCEEMGRKGKKIFLKHFTAKKVIAATERLYSKVLKNRLGSRF